MSEFPSANAVRLVDVSRDSADLDAELDALAQDLIAAKSAAADIAKQVRLIEEQILERVGNKSEGSRSKSTGRFKFTTTGRVNRTIDKHLAQELYTSDELPDALYTRLFKWEPKLDLRELRFIEQNEPQYFAVVSKVVTSNPGKTSVTVSPIE